MNRWFERLNQRSRGHIFGGIVLILFLLLLLQLFRFTIVDGGKYRNLADQRRVKEIALTAKRGAIRDRNGLILAGNRPVFTVQLLKDELDGQKLEEKNQNFLILSRFLEEDGAEPMDVFPLNLNVFVYGDIKDYSREESPEDIVVELLKEPAALEGFLTSAYEKPYGDHFSYEVLPNLLKNISDDLPFDLQSGALIYGAGHESFLRDLGLEKEATPMAAMVAYLQGEDSALRVLLGHPVARKLAYDTVGARARVRGVGLRTHGNDYFDQYIAKKAQLLPLHSKITWESSAKEDFIHLVQAYALPNLLEDEDFVAELLAHYQEKKGPGDYRHLKGRILLDKRDVTDEILKAYEDEDFLASLLSREDNASLAQMALIEAGVNASISVAQGYQYTQIKNAQDLFQRVRLKPQEGSKKLWEEFVAAYELQGDLSIYEQENILSIYEAVKEQGSYAYIPVNYAYEIENETVAKIEENLASARGIQVSVEPIRSYPYGQRAAHALGYIGSIAQEQEIQRYIKELGYDRNALIGKTGIEERFELQLRGTLGTRRVQVDSTGNTTNIIEEIAPQQGNDVLLTLDSGLQKQVEESMERGLAEIRGGGMYYGPWGSMPYLTSSEKGRPYREATSGAAVVLDVRNGDILAMSSYPAYDPNLFSKGIRPADWALLQTKEEDNPLAARPLYNIALQSAIQPGSIFKMISGLAAEKLGLDPNLTIQDGGFVTVGGQVFGNWLWNQKRELQGPENLATAIRDSNNYYFYSLGLGEDQKTGTSMGVTVGPKDIDAMAQAFGLGEKTNIEINIPQESRGIRPDPQAKTQTMKALLSRHLEANMDHYVPPEATVEEREAMKETLVALVGEEPLSRPELYKKMEKMGMNPDAKAPNDRVPIVDLIKYTYLDQARWKMADTMNILIGQGENAYTPIQLARYTMTLANRGHLYDLHLVKSVTGKNNGSYQKKVVDHPLDLPDAYYDPIQEGMEMVAKNSIIGKLYADFPVDVALKTGTAERSGQNPYTGETFDSFAWQVGYAPADNPEIAVAIVLFQGGSGTNASPMMQEIFAEYLGFNKKVEPSTLPVETTVAY
ncbi:MAG: penicillin-binding transpeptidase domain-containing protein [Tissierellia bacterium]|nr:penicillin-binding transpeptidase domain-containing protein [Tissierellia bacterium]